MPIPDELEHNETAWELRQKAIDLRNEAVAYDQENKGKFKRDITGDKPCSLKELFELGSITRKAQNNHSKADNAWAKYSDYTFRLNAKYALDD